MLHHQTMHRRKTATRRISLLHLALPLGILIFGCSTDPQKADPQSADAGVEAVDAPPADIIRSLELHQETVTREDGSVAEAERGVIEVPYIREIRRAEGESARELGLELYRFKRSANADPDTPPIFLLRGGPGYEGLRPLLDRPGYFENRLEPHLDISDLIVVGQRGFGSSADTACEAHAPLPDAGKVDSEVRVQLIQEASRQCRQKWLDQGVPLQGLNVIEAAADVYDIARALGYSKIQLRGISFGSHWGMAVMRFHPELVARAVLGGLEGPDHTYDMPTGVLGALERMAKDAEASPALEGEIPQAGLLASFKALIAQAEAEPIRVTVKDPNTEQDVEVWIDATAMRNLSRGYSRGTSWRHIMPSWTADLLTMIRGDFSDAAQDMLENRLDTGMPAAAFFMLDCGSGISKARAEQLRSDPAIQVVGDTGWFYDTACPLFESDLGEDFRKNFDTDIPTLMVQGTWDTSTPYENALELKPHFKNLHFVTVEGGSHGALREAEEDVEGFREALVYFSKTGDGSRLPERVDLGPIEWLKPGQ